MKNKMVMVVHENNNNHTIKIKISINVQFWITNWHLLNKNKVTILKNYIADDVSTEWSTKKFVKNHSPT